MLREGGKSQTARIFAEKYSECSEKDSEKILLEYFQMDLLQISGAYLHQHDINTEFLFTDEGYKKTWLKSHSSTFL